jgi:hypothetical protein
MRKYLPCHCATTNFVPHQAPINSAHLSRKMFHTCCSRFIQSVTWPAIDPGTDPSPQMCYGASGLLSATGLPRTAPNSKARRGRDVAERKRFACRERPAADACGGLLPGLLPQPTPTQLRRIDVAHPIPDLLRTNRPQRKGNLHDSRGRPNSLMDRSPTAARPASRRATGIRNGEQDT